MRHQAVEWDKNVDGAKRLQREERSIPRDECVRLTMQKIVVRPASGQVIFSEVLECAVWTLDGAEHGSRLVV